MNNDNLLPLDSPEQIEQEQGGQPTPEPGGQPKPPASMQVDLSQREMLLEVADKASIWRNRDGEVYATIEVDGHQEHHAVNSRGFKDWLLTRLANNYEVNGRPASAGATAIIDAIAAIGAKAFANGKVKDSPLRVTLHEGAIHVDTGCPEWRAFKVTKGGGSGSPAPRHRWFGHARPRACQNRRKAAVRVRAYGSYETCFPA